MNKRLIKGIIACALCAALAFALAACGKDDSAQDADTQTADKKPLVVCTLFPQYDFAARIAGEHAQVAQLLPAGMDSHEYEPSAGEVLFCDKADLFVYTDDELETWVKNIKGGFTHVKCVRCAEGIDLEELNEIWEHEGENHESEAHEHGHGHEHAYDAHIWLDPVLAVKMCENIRDALISTDSAHAQAYTESCAQLVSEINALDAEFAALFAQKPDALLCFGGKFAYSHFLRRYGVKYISAYDDCSDSYEPGTRRLLELEKQMKAAGARVVFTDELSDGGVARQIAADTGAEVLLFHTCHNLTSANEQSTYLSLMRQNLQNIRKALGEA